MPSTQTRLAVWAAADAAVLIALCPRPVRLAHELADPSAWFERAGTDTALAVLAATALWLVAVWLGVGLLAALATRLPGALGRGSAAVATTLLPRVLYRVAAGSAGLGILLGPVLATGVADASPAPTGAPATSSAASVPAPTWPSAGPGSSSLPAPTTAAPTTTTAPTPTPTPSVAAPTSVPAPIWPHDASPTASPPTTRATPPASRQPGAGRHPHQPRAHAAATSSTHDRTADRTTDHAGVTVHADDSLWLLAARRLGPGATTTQIAHEWPRWYAANRTVIGDDPDLIRPGQVLHAPSMEAR